MLRRTVSTAFAAAPGPRLASVDPGAPLTRQQAVSRLFSALHEALAERARRLERESEYGKTAAMWLRLSRERALLDGLEFVLETPASSFRFLNTLGGSIEVQRVEESRLELVEILSVQRSHTDFAPIRKDAGERSAFAFTTVRALVERYARPADRTDC